MRNRRRFLPDNGILAWSRELGPSRILGVSVKETEEGASSTGIMNLVVQGRRRQSSDDIAAAHVHKETAD